LEVVEEVRVLSMVVGVGKNEYSGVPFLRVELESNLLFRRG